MIISVLNLTREISKFYQPETCSGHVWGMAGGEIIADDIKSIGDTIGGRIITKNVEKNRQKAGCTDFNKWCDI